MNSQQNNSVIDPITDNQFCQMCGISSKQRTLTEVSTDTIEDPKKMLMCEICLSVHNLSLLCVSERKKTKEDERFVTELQVSRRKESRFRMNVYEKILESTNLEFEEQDLINSAAEEIGISPTTARRYLDKMCSSAGVLTRYDDGNNTFVRFEVTRGDFE